MSSSRGLTRRRRQPLRRCKRFRGNPGGGPFLMDVPEPVLGHILGFTMWDDNEDAAAECLALWKWTGQLGIVCRLFRKLARKVAPETLAAQHGYTPVSFLRSFVEASWKKHKLQEFACIISLDDTEDGSLSTLQRLFETPGSFPNLTRLSLFLRSFGDPRGNINAEFLYDVARSCPILADLTFRTESLNDVPITPEQLGNFARLLQTPLNECELWGKWVTNQHLDTFLREQGRGLISFVPKSRNVDDSTLDIISTHCSQLKKLSLAHSSITDNGLSSFCQKMGDLTELNVVGCALMPGYLIRVLNTHCPRLERILFGICYSFTDACLEDLVQGQIDYWAGQREDIPLCMVRAVACSVTYAGIKRVLAKPNLGHLEIHYINRDTHDIEVLTAESFPVSQEEVTAT